MQAISRLATVYLIVLTVIGLSGCFGTQQTIPAPSEQEGDAHGHDHGAHGAHDGPHGGQVVVLGGNHEYHAELVKDTDAKQVSVYMLDGQMKPLAIAADSVTINLTINGKPQSFTLAAVNPTDGKAEQFDAVDAALYEALLYEAFYEAMEDQSPTPTHVTGRLSVTIDGTPFIGNLELSAHDHGDGHDHAAHDADDGHDHAEGDGHDHAAHDGDEGHDHAEGDGHDEDGADHDHDHSEGDGHDHDHAE